MPQNYTSYHTNIKLCFSLGIEKQIFPKTYLEKIPTSTSVYWKNKSTEYYSGTEFEELAQCILEDLKIMQIGGCKKADKYMRRIADCILL